MKNLFMVSVVFFILTGMFCLHAAFDLRCQRSWFHELRTDWHLFESDYTEDIKNIDKLRDELEWEKGICQEWEKIAMEFKWEAVEYKMKYKEQYTINNIGLLSHGQDKPRP